MWGEEGIERGNTNLASVHILQMKRKTFHARTWGGFTTRHQLETCSFLPGKALDWSIQKLDFSFHLASDKPRLLLIQPSRYLNLQNGIVSEVKPSPILVSASFGGGSTFLSSPSPCRSLLYPSPNEFDTTAAWSLLKDDWLTLEGFDEPTLDHLLFSPKQGIHLVEQWYHLDQLDRIFPWLVDLDFRIHERVFDPKDLKKKGVA